MNLKKNMGMLDRVIRIGIALIAIALILFGIVEGVFALILGVVAIIFLLTSFVSFCPLYTLFGLKTCKDCTT